MKRRIMALILSLVMILGSIQFERIIVEATDAEFTFTLSGEDATITGYTDTTVSSLVIPETIQGDNGVYNVVAIADKAFSWDKYPNLTDLTVRGAEVTIGNKICGFDNEDSRNENLVLWGQKDSTIGSYADSQLIPFKVVTSTMTDIDTEADLNECYTNGGEFKVYTYITVEGEEAAEDIIWESENPEQVKVTAFGKPTAQNDGTYKAEAQVKVLTKGDGNCKIYAYTRGLAEKKETEVTILQSATSIDIDVKVYTSEDDGATLIPYEAPETYFQNNLVTADVGKYLVVSATAIGSEDDYIKTGWLDHASDDFWEYVRWSEEDNGYVFRLVDTTAEGFTNFTFTTKSLVCTKSLNLKITLPAEAITMKFNDDVVMENDACLLIEGQTAKLEAAFTPNDSTDAVTWRSSNTNVATVAEDGTLVTHNAGTTIIYCKVKDTAGAVRDLETYFNLSVSKKILYNKLGLSTTINGAEVKEIDLEAGTSMMIYPIDLEPGESTPNEPLIYTSSDSKILTVENVDEKGNLTAIAGKTGRVTITASAMRGNSNASTTMVVNTYVKTTGINISSSEQIPEGQSKVLEYTLNPSGATEEVIWTPTDPTIATVSDNGDGTITINALKMGNTQIVGRSKTGGATKTVQVVVQEAIHMNTMGIVVNDTTSYRTSYEDEEGIMVYEVPKGKKIILMPSYDPVNANDGLKWYYDVDTSDVVDSTIVGGNRECIAVKAGTQLVTLRSTNGLVAKCKIKVIVPATKMEICKAGSTSVIARVAVAVDETYGITAQMGSNVTDKCTWTTDNDNVELNTYVSENKEVVYIRGVKPGKTIITATSEEGQTSTLEVVVNIPATDIAFYEDGVQIPSTGLDVLLDSTKTVTLNVEPENTTAEVYTWTSDYGRVKIEVSDNGKMAVITGESVGSDKIKVTADTGLVKSFNVNVLQPTETISFACSETTINKGSSVTATATLNPTTANDGVTYTVDKEGIVSLAPSKDGKSVTITGTGVGTVTITATTGSGKTATITLTVVTIEASELTITGISSTGYAYTGKEITPSVTVKYGTKSLAKGTDYTLSYKDNIDVTDSATVVVTGIGKYSGTQELTFKITPKSGPAIKFADNNSTSISREYNGAEYKPEVKITDGSVSLINGKDYDVEYPENPIEKGSYKVKVTFKGNYSGSKTVTYSITARSISDKAITVTGISVGGYTYTGEAIKPSIVVKDGSAVLTEGSDADYTISYSGNLNASTDKAKGKVTIKGVGNYKDTTVVEFVINPAQISSTVANEIPDKVYTGSALIASISLKYKDKSVSSTNYTYEYIGNVNTGKATIKITGKGNFTGTKNIYFNILPRDVKDVKQTKATNSSVTLTWAKSAGGVSGYKIYSYNASTKRYKYIGSTSKNTYTVSKLSAGSDYSYVVSAYKTVGSAKYEGKYSMTCSAKTVPGKPALQKATPLTSGVKLTWKKTTGATQYHIYYSSNGKKYTLKTKTSATTANITGLKSKKKHFFKIKAVRNIGGKEYTSVFSVVKSAKAK